MLLTSTGGVLFSNPQESVQVEETRRIKTKTEGQEFLSNATEEGKRGDDREREEREEIENSLQWEANQEPLPSFSAGDSPPIEREDGKKKKKKKKRKSMLLHGTIGLSYDNYLLAYNRLGGGINGLFAWRNEGQYPTSFISYTFRLGTTFTPKNNPDLKFDLNLRSDENNYVYRVNAGRTSNRPSGLYNAGFVRTRAGSGVPRLFVGLSRLSMNYSKKDLFLELEVGDDLDMHLHDALLSLTGSGFQWQITNRHFNFQSVVSRIASSSGNFNTESEIFRTGNREGISGVNRWIHGARLDYRIPFRFSSARKEDGITLSAAYVHMINMISRERKGLQLDPHYLYIRIRSSGGIGAFLLRRDSASISILINRSQEPVVIYDDRDEGNRDLKDPEVLLDPYLIVEQPQTVNPIYLLDGRYIQPTSYLGGRNLSAGQLTWRIPLRDIDGGYDVEDIEAIELNFFLQGSYVIEISLDRFNWAVVGDSRDLNGGQVNTFFQQSIRDRAAETGFVVRIDPSRFRRDRQRYLLNSGIRINLWRSEWNIDYTYNAYQGYGGASEATSFFDFNFSLPIGKSLTITGDVSTMGIDYASRLDGTAVFDFNHVHPLNRVFTANYESGLYSPFDSVADNDNAETKLKGYYGKYAFLDDREEAYVPGRLLPGIYYSFPDEIYRPYLRPRSDDNNNLLPDEEENDVYRDYGAIPGETTVGIGVSWQKKNMNLQTQFQYKRRVSRLGRNLGYAFEPIENGLLSSLPLESASEMPFEAYHIDLDFQYNLSKEYSGIIRSWEVTGIGNLKYAKDAIDDHTYEQRKVTHFREAHVADFDALENYNAFHLNWYADFSLEIGWFLEIETFFRNSTISFIKDNAYEGRIARIFPSQDDYFYSRDSFYTAAAYKISRGKLIYRNGANYNRLIYDLDLVFNIPFYRWMSRRNRDRYPLIFKAGILSHLDHNDLSLAGFTDIFYYDKKTYDFDFYTSLFLEKDEKSKIGLSFRYRITDDLNGDRYSGRGFILSVYTRYELNYMDLFFGYRLFEFDYDQPELLRLNSWGVFLDNVTGNVFFGNLTFKF